VQVHYDEGLAIHIGPESCGGIRGGWSSEALTGERIGQPLSRESVIFPEAHVFEITGRHHGGARYRERFSTPAWSETLACAEVSCAEPRRSRV